MMINCLLELSEAGQRFEGYAIVRSVQAATTANGSPYFHIIISKKQKQVKCKLWENNFGNQSVSELKQVFQGGTAHYISGTTSEYREELQLTIEHFRAVEEGEVELSEYLESAPEPIESLQAAFEQFIQQIKSPILRTICEQLYEEHQSSFLTFPAGKSNHHAYLGGLLFHTVSMLRIAQHIVGQYPQVNRDLIFAAISLHDLGKVVELSGSIAPEYTKVGHFLGHITIVNMFVDRKVQKLKEEDGVWSRADFEQAYELMHVISAHHGKLEWGSPVTSRILEAEVIHHIDMLDSRINMITNGLEDENLQDHERKNIYPLGSFYRTTVREDL